MGILPFDDWIYHLSWMRDEVNRIHQEAVDTQNTVQSRVLNFNGQLDKVKLLVSNNALLVLIEKMVRMDDLKLKDFTVDIDALPPPVKGDVVLNALSSASELVGGALLFKFLFNLGKVVKNAIFESVEGVTVEGAESLGNVAVETGVSTTVEGVASESLEAATEEVTETVISSATSATLAATGIGIFLAVGIDVIFGAINGAKEKKELQEILDKLQTQLDLVKTYLNTVNKKSKDLEGTTVDQMTLFKNICTSMTSLLPKGHKPTFDYSFPSELKSLDDCLAAQKSAIDQFGLLTSLRNTYEKARERNPKVTKDVVINSVLLTAPMWVDYTLLLKIWDEVLAKYSTLMAQAA